MSVEIPDARGRNLGKKAVGKKGEEVAVAYLIKKRYSILDRNFVCRFGELDIVAREGKTIVFVEVKSRRDQSYGPPQLAVTEFKQRQIARAATFYLLQKKETGANARFDVIAIVFHPSEGVVLLDHIENAFELPGNWI
jgi:putative endonuclease